MERDDFIITVYLLVCELYAEFQARYCSHRPLRGLRTGGFAPAFTDEEVITLEICGEHFKHHTDQDLYDYFACHYRHFFPRLPDRVAFVRQAANLWQVKAWIQQRLVQRSGADRDRLQIIDTIPVPVCGLARAARDRCFAGEADRGYCAAKKMPYYGFKLGLRIARSGMIVHYPLLAARPNDVKHLFALVEERCGMVAGDKGFWDPFGHALLEEQQGAMMVVPRRKNMKQTTPHPEPVHRACSYWRKRIETVGSQLCEHFALARIRVRDLWHLQHRIIRKVLSHTVAVFLNLQSGRPPLDLDDLVLH
jgi:hypothetical protein